MPRTLCLRHWEWNNIQRGDYLENNKLNILESEIRKTFASVVWSHKIQEKQSDLHYGKYKFFETLNIIITTLTSVGVFSSLINNSYILKLISTILAFSSLFITLYFYSFDLNNRWKYNKDTANKLLKIRNKLELLLVYLKIEIISLEDIKNEYESISDTLYEIYDSAPQTTNKAVKLAEIALINSRDNTFSEEQIDSFLPKYLRKGDA